MIHNCYFPKIHHILRFAIILFLLVACQPPPTPPPANNRDVRTLPAPVSGSFNINNGIHLTAIVRSPSELVVTIHVLKPTDTNENFLKVRQKLISIDAITATSLDTPAVQLQSKILNDYDTGVTLPLNNTDTLVALPYDVDTDVGSLDIPPENTFTYIVPLHPSQPNQAHALIIERFQDEELVSRLTTLFILSGDTVIQ
jgi:hypothetical protein